MKNKIDVLDKLRSEGPKLFLVGRPDFDYESFLKFLETEGETWLPTDEAAIPENIVEAAGRLCYMSFSARQFRKCNRDYIHNLIKQGHESVLEHVSWSFILSGVSRAFTHQLVRHRVGFSFSQLSQQYHDENDATFVMPTIIARFENLAESWRRSVRQSKRAYQELLSHLQSETYNRLTPLEKKEFHRAVRTAARSVLPNATETKIFVTANARSIRHFLAVRGGIPGDEEMRTVSALILETLNQEAPSLFSDFAIEQMADGTPIVRQVPIEENTKETPTLKEVTR
jgi:thymidylate synthase (FAD)